jgi:hypothetical protein
LLHHLEMEGERVREREGAQTHPFIRH